ncbi:MAG: lysine--tRNA ligase [Candidatus Theseobacter exili]|nr:lysine--tRNA ligase [Candidatus Theseobacter exili]
METPNDQIMQRKEKLQKLIDMGVELYSGSVNRSHSCKEAVDQFEEGHEVTLAGRIKALRWHGKAVFGDLEDASGKVQFYAKKDAVGERFAELSLLDIGDILCIVGDLFRTRTGEVTVLIKDFKIVSKSLRPLPEKWHGLKDVEMRYRYRYLDLISNSDVAAVFKRRSRAISLIRSFLDEKDFLEVETPMMQSMAGGATARPFVTHHQALGVDLYLRIAPELYLKRLIVGGLEKIYELNRNFRNEGLSRFHNPEFTMLEIYQAYADYNVMMNLTEELVVFLCEKLLDKLELGFGDKTVEFKPPWKRLTFHEAIREIAGVDIDSESIQEEAERIGVDCSDCESKRDNILNEIFEKVVQPKLISPTFIIDYPSSLCPLSRPKSGQPELAERFELFVLGQEIANAYSELNDPGIQYEMFKKQAGLDLKKIDVDYVRALEHGMPSAGGLGIGIDRLMMLLTGAASIRDVILFPQLRPEQEKSSENEPA